MKIVFYDQIDCNSMLYNDLVKLLACCDTEFVPPLSSREGTRQKVFRENTEMSLSIVPTEYVNALMQQKSILALSDDHLVGFMSFIFDFEDNELFEPIYNKSGCNNYISTICIDPSYRKQGIASMLYSYIENDLPDPAKSCYVSTRTWSTNTGHLELLKKRGYTLTHTILRNRAHDGVEIDTVYYCKELKQIGGRING